MRTYRYIPFYYFYWSLYNYAAHAADNLTPTFVVQGVDNHSWGLYCRRCYCTRVCWRLSSRMFHFFTLTWSTKHSLNQGWESTHRLHLYPWVVFTTHPSIEHWVEGTSILRLIAYLSTIYFGVSIFDKLNWAKFNSKPFCIIPQCLYKIYFMIPHCWIMVCNETDNNHYLDMNTKTVIYLC